MAGSVAGGSVGEVVEGSDLPSQGLTQEECPYEKGNPAEHETDSRQNPEPYGEAHWNVDGQKPGDGELLRSSSPVAEREVHQKDEPRDEKELGGNVQSKPAFCSFSTPTLSTPC